MKFVHASMRTWSRDCRAYVAVSTLDDLPCFTYQCHSLSLLASCIVTDTDLTDRPFTRHDARIQ